MASDFHLTSSNDLLRSGRRANNIADSRLRRNTEAIVIAGIGGVFSAGCFISGDIAEETFYTRELPIAFYGLGAATISVTI